MANMRKRDIKRLWSQIIHQMGKDRYTNEEWQTSFKDFYTCMQSPTQPYIRVENIDHLLKWIQPPKENIVKMKSQKIKEEEDLEKTDDLESLAVLQKRIKLEEEKNASKARTLPTANGRRLLRSGAAILKIEADEQQSINSYVKEGQKPFDPPVDQQNSLSILKKEIKEEDQSSKDLEIKQEQKSGKTKQKNQKQPKQKNKTVGPRKNKAVSSKTKGKKKSEDVKQMRELDCIPAKVPKKDPSKSKRGRKPKKNPTSNPKPVIIVSASLELLPPNKFVLLHKINEISNAHMPPTPVNLTCKSSSIEVEAISPSTEDVAEDLKVVRNQEPEQNYWNSVTTENSVAGELDEKSSIISFDESNLKDQLIDEIMLSEPINSYQDISLLLNENTDNELCIDTAENSESASVPDDEVIEHYLQCCNSKTPSEIDHEASNPSQLFDNIPNLTTEELRTPLELDAMIEDVFNFDYDDDVLSVATSWDGDDIIPNEQQTANRAPNIPIKPRQAENKPKEYPTVAKDIPAAAAKPHTSELRRFRISKLIDRKMNEVDNEVGNVLEKRIPERNESNQEQNGFDAANQTDNNGIQKSQKATNFEKQRAHLPQQKNRPEQQPDNGKIQLPKEAKLQERRLKPLASLPTSNLKQQLTKETNSQLKRTLNGQQQPRITRNQRGENGNWTTTNNCNGLTVTTANRPPLFAPPIRVPLEQPTTLPIVPSISGIYSCKSTIFGIKCWSYLNGRCQKISCNHRLGDIGDVKRRLNPLNKSQLIGAYSFILRHGMLFKIYFSLFAEIFGSRSMLKHLVKMVEDCALYLNYCAPLTIDLYSLMLRYKITPEEAASHFMKHLWKPNIATLHPQLALQLLRIVASSDWYNYYSCIDNLFINQGFPVPVEFLTTIAKDAVTKNQPLLIQKAMKLLLYSSIKIKAEGDILPLIEILQELSRCQQAHQQIQPQEQQQQQMLMQQLLFQQQQQQMQQQMQQQQLQMQQQQQMQPQMLDSQMMQLMLSQQQQFLPQHQVEPFQQQQQFLQQQYIYQQPLQEHQMQQQQLQPHLHQHLQQPQQHLQQQQFLQPAEGLVVMPYGHVEDANVSLLPF